MKIKDGRGQHKKIKEAENMDKIKKWFHKNPDSTQTECREKLGFSLTTIRKHLRAMGHI